MHRPGASSLEDVKGLRAYLDDRLAGRPMGQGRAARLLLDALGLGLEQTVTFIGRERPDHDRFVDWILSTAGPPDPLRVMRFNAWLDRAPPPAPVRAWLDGIAAMDPVLTDRDLEHWRAEGYVILSRAISGPEAAAVEALIWQEAGADPARPDSWYGPRTNGIMLQRFQHPAMEAARRSPRVHKAFAQLWGTADLWSTTDRLSFNPPLTPHLHYREPGLHWDVSLARPIPFATQGILYLTDTPADQGAFRLVPGFHHRIDRWLDDLDGADPRRINLDDQARCIAARAGDLIIWRNDLPHGASPNTGLRPRMAQYVNMYSPELETNPVWL
ncbi:MAG: phytanoyl-CoA dioxygenase family protein [Caulobacter sp.]|nr:phytanoyl-CoA dioxygenase family protein [Caulobacter sp.]